LAEEEKKLLLDLANANKANSIAIYDSTVADLKKVEDKIKTLDDQIKNLKQSIIDLEK
jgi:putative heme iron utilization protein